jgi:endogenous inhibitor of DNA gyrase (YacG/DUF329 family)
MNYKQKTCPRCGTVHKKRGPYCSRSCGNVREHTEEDKAIRSQKLLEYHQTPEGAATRAKAAKHLAATNRGEEIEMSGVDDYAVNIPDVTDYVAEYDITWERAEKW